VKPALYP